MTRSARISCAITGRAGPISPISLPQVLPEDIDYVLCTHLHADHVGWNTRLLDGRWVPTFPNARYLFARAEWEHWGVEQMYVEALTPRHPRSRYPLVLIHGAAQMATNWMGTPDGRPGWADYFVGQGYTVYMVDQPARGRSLWLPEVDGKLATFTAEQIESRFTAPQVFTLWPQAKLHSQWPGTGRIGDPAFDAFYATQVPYLADNVQTQRLTSTQRPRCSIALGPRSS
jgi:pimeloyl-ACP methyl ester carboxylesterase